MSPVPPTPGTGPALDRAASPGATGGSASPVSSEAVPDPDLLALPWRLDDFERSLTSLSANTVAAYGRDLGAFVAWAGRGGLDRPGSVTRLALRRYLAHLTTRGYAARSIARKASALRRYFSWCRSVGAIDADPARSLHAPSGDGRLPRVLTTAELDSLLDAPPAAVETDPPHIRIRDDAVMELLYGGGLRVGE